jgi:hypothetical protein
MGVEHLTVTLHFERATDEHANPKRAVLLAYDDFPAPL